MRLGFDTFKRMHRKWWSKCEPQVVQRDIQLHHVYIKQNPTVSPPNQCWRSCPCVCQPQARLSPRKTYPCRSDFCIVLLCFAMFCYVLVTWYRHWKLSIPVPKFQPSHHLSGPKRINKPSMMRFATKASQNPFLDQSDIPSRLEYHPVGDMSVMSAKSHVMPRKTSPQTSMNVDHWRKEARKCAAIAIRSFLRYAWHLQCVLKQNCKPFKLMPELPHSITS